MQEKVDREPLVCRKCGSKRFVMVSERVVRDAVNVDGEMAAEHTVENERILSLECAECGETLFLRCAEKPIPEREWRGFWEGHISDFIIAFEHYAVNWDVEGEDETKYDAFLKGMATGMWTIYNMLESELVRERSNLPKQSSEK